MTLSAPSLAPAALPTDPHSYSGRSLARVHHLALALTVSLSVAACLGRPVVMDASGHPVFQGTTFGHRAGEFFFWV